MTYQETLDFLYAQLPMFSRIGPAALKKDLTNTRLLADLAGNPHKHLKTIHIAGTNGKGSSSHMLASIFQAAGYKTGLYTSPHLQDFRERIRVNGRMIPEQEVIDFTENYRQSFLHIEPSFFEVTVVMAFEYFLKEKTDIAIIETGLGGRLDSTNIITPELSLITNIGLDHVHLLGDTLEKIAYEKAGIIKAAVPVVVSQTQTGPDRVFRQKAEAEKSPIVFGDAVRQTVHTEAGTQTLDVTYHNSHTDKSEKYRTDLTGLYQAANMAGVLSAIDILRQKGWNISDAAVETGLGTVKANTGLMGRWEILQESPLVVFDVGHNEDGMRQIITQLQHTGYNQLHIVIGMVSDKDVEKVLRLLPTNAYYYFTQAAIPRALPSGELKSLAEAKGLKGQSYETVDAAVKEAYSRVRSNDLLLICGSVFVVGEVDRGIFRPPSPL